MHRRDFLLMRAGPRGARSLDLSCERLYMRYVDAMLDGTTGELFADLEQQLRDADELRLADSDWLAREDLQRQLAPLLERFRARGGAVTTLPAR